MCVIGKNDGGLRMDVKVLKTFITVAETGSFSAASRQLNYAQSSVSDQIKKLEIELDVPLFDRIGQRIQLTTKGQTMLCYARQMVALYDESLAAMNPQGETDLIRGCLKIAITETLCFYKFPNLFKRFHHLYPEVDLKLKLGNCYDFPQWLQDNSIDLAFVLDDRQVFKHLISKTLSEEKLLLVVSSDHRLASNQKISYEAFQEETLIVTQAGSRYRGIIDRFIHQKNLVFNHTLEFESVEAIKYFVKSGLGIGFIPELVVASELKNGECVALEIDDFYPSIRAEVLYHKDKWLSPPMARMLEIIRDEGYE